MKKSILFASLLMTTVTQAQTTLFSETFEGGTSGQFTLNTSDMSSTTAGINDWVVNNVYSGGTGSIVCLGFPFTFSVATTASQPAGITGMPNSYYMHLRSDAASASGINCSSYSAADGLCNFAEKNFTKMSADISTMGYTGVSFSFWWACGGSSTNYGEVYYSTNGGSTWNLVTTPISQYLSQTNWIQQTITLPAFDNQATIRFGFRFVNDVTSTASEPAFQLDDIKITGNGCVATGFTQSPTICQGTSFFAQGANQTAAGTYYDTLVNSCGLDSVVTTVLSVTPVNVTTTTAGITITASATPATYQWINCATMAPIGGETNQAYTPSANGSYAVIVTQSSCSDTSACVPITLGINQLTNTNSFTVSPNPFNQQTIITLNNGSIEKVNVIMTDAIGRKVYPGITKSENKIILDRNNIANGTYFVQLNNGAEIKTTIKVVLN